MDLPSKATARSKWRSSQSHKPHSRPSSSVPGKPSKTALESNFDRYEEEVDTRPGQARLSQGEDLAALLRDAEGLQQAARHRTSLPAEPEVELLESALQGKEPQGLTLDMEALAQALSFIPLHQVLGLDPKYFPGKPEAQPSQSASSAVSLDSNAASSTYASSSGPPPASVSAPANDPVSPQSDGTIRPASSPQTARQPSSQPAARSDAEQHAAGNSMATAEAERTLGDSHGKDKGYSGAARSSAVSEGRADTPAAASNPDPSLSSRVQQPVVHKPANPGTPSPIAQSSSSSSSSRSPSSQSQQLSGSRPAVVAHTSGAKTGMPSSGEVQHSAPGSSGGRAGSKTSSAAKPSSASVAATNDDNDLDAILGMGSAAAPASVKQQKSHGRDDDDDDDLDALLGLDKHGSPASAQPQKGRGSASGPRQNPAQNESLESFLDSL